VHYWEEITGLARGNNPILLLSIVREESYFNPDAVSVAGARGLMQLMPQTAAEVKNSYGLQMSSNYWKNPADNIKLGALYYGQLRKMLEDNDFLTILAYNGGVGSVKTWRSFLNYKDFDEFLEQVPYPETQNYLKKVLRSYWNYTRIY